MPFFCKALTPSFAESFIVSATAIIIATAAIALMAFAPAREFQGANAILAKPRAVLLANVPG